MKRVKKYAKYVAIIAVIIVAALIAAFMLPSLQASVERTVTYAAAATTTPTITATYATTSPTTRAISTLSGVVNGAGASFLNPQMQAWASKFYELTGGRIQINYQSIGSGAGQAKFREGILDFAGSDPPLKPEIYDEFKEKGGIVQFPVIIGTIAVVYNIPNVESGKLKLTGEVIAKIYMGEIVYWDDPAIKALNPELNLPHEKIIAVHRSDGSGTTRVFTAYLSKVSESWKNKVGSDLTVEWPVDKLGNGVGAKGNEGVAAAVQQNRYSIGYVETAYAHSAGLSIALIRNRDGNYVLPTKEAVASAAKALIKVLPRADEDWSSIFPDETVDPPGSESYPITSFSFVILRQVYDDPVKVAILKEFFEWVLTEGQKPENIVEGYEPLPPEVAAIGLNGLKLLRTG
ncbi:MAG: phosphate ABC transporter substrate-binding protein PstS [Aigarchaeota archaeon]|nr:phosphate ABC transporter substrate-binding protein PstS [Candidatus Wolframiiraptor gerlachensis]